MRSIFSKLFVSFWLTILLGGAMSFIVVSTFHHLSIQLLRDDMSKRMDANMTRLIVLSGQAAEQMYRCGGPAEYDNFIKGLVDNAGIRINLIGADERTITGKPVSKELAKLAEAAGKGEEALLSKSATALIVAKRLPAKNGDSLVVVGSHTFGPPPGMLPEGEKPSFFVRFLPPFFGRGEIIRATIMFFLIFVVCYFLARSLATPIRKLQTITRQIAGGDYSARIGESLGGTSNEIAELGRDFDIMVDRTEKVITSQKRLLRDISHELRSPLARLNVALELAKKRFDADNDKALNKIGQEADRLNGLIEQLLTLTLLESGAGIRRAEAVNLPELLREVVEDVDFEEAGNNRGVIIASSAEVTVTGSRELLWRALENIIRNGARFTASGSQVKIFLSVSSENAVITVIDSGPGVPEADLPHLFEPFYRVAEARERQSGGAGIGLAIARQAVKAHGGTVVAVNGSGEQGLIVTITLPLDL